MAFLESLAAFGAALAPALGRSVVGWAENALSDASDGGKNITRYEWLQGAQTVLRVVFYQLLIFLSWEGFVGNADVVASGAAAVIFDIAKRAVEKQAVRRK